MVLLLVDLWGKVVWTHFTILLFYFIRIPVLVCMK